MSSSKLFQLLVKKEAANGFPVGALFLISGGSHDGRWGSEPMSKFHFLLKFSNQSLHPCVFASALNDANMQTLSDNCPHLLQGYTCSTWTYCRHFLIEVAYPTMTRPRVSTMLMQTNICCNSGMKFMSICFVRDHDVCLMQCVWNDVPVLCMIGSVVQAHGKKKGNNGDPNLETRSVRFVKHWPSNQQWATSLFKLNLCRCLCPYIRVYRCRHECTYMRTCVCMYIYIYIYIVACECWLMLFACFATRVHENQFVTCATLKTICDGNQLEAADRSLRLAYHLLRVHMWNNM